MIEIILLTFLGLILGWREVQNVIHKLYYEHYKDFFWQPSYWNYDSFNKWFWWTEYKSKWKNFDSYHFLVGLAVLIISFSVAYCQDSYIINIPNIPMPTILNLFLWTVIYWIWVFYWRNITMHVILPKKGHKRLWYLIPLIGVWLKGK